MYKQGDEVHLNQTEARGGTTPHIVRYVLVASMALVVIAFIILLALWQ